MNNQSEWIPYHAVQTLGTGPALILTPHPDDEVFGCAGAILRHVAVGDPVTVIILTDGGGGRDNGPERTAYVAQRRQESRNAAAILGYGEPVFWDVRDRELTSDTPFVQRLCETVITTGARWLYAPSPTENHPDHRHLGMAALQVLHRVNPPVILALYEISAPLPPNRLLDISDLLERKRQAIACFISQLATQAYDRQIEALNRYRTYTLSRDIAAVEAYCVVEKDDAAEASRFFAAMAAGWRRTSSVPALVSSEPLVSVIVRTLGRPELTEALASIAAQTYGHLEVVVVDATGAGAVHPGSQCGRFPLLVVRTGQRLGRSAAANLGLDQANGEFLIFLDDDDWFEPDHISSLVDLLRIETTTVAAYAGVRCIRRSLYGQWETTRIYNDSFDATRLRVENFIPIHALLFRRTVLSGPTPCRFDEQLNLYEDWDFWLQLLERGTFHHRNAVSACYRIHDSGSLVNASRQQLQEVFQSIVRKWRGRWNDQHLMDVLIRARTPEPIFPETVELRSGATRNDTTQPLRITHQFIIEGPTAAVHGDAPPSTTTIYPPPYRAILVDVIIPVYRGVAETRVCLSSVLHSRQSVPHEIIVIDDASPEPALTDYLHELATAGRITLLRSAQNLGFVQTVNRGMTLHGERDVVLLNSDTKVVGDWLDRLTQCAYSEPEIGTVTPFSNNATICSYPQTCADNALPPGYTVETLDALFRRVNPGQSVSIPTAVGFCMYIRRDCLRAVGLFDATRFGKGYGEENDFCLRAAAVGWRHLLCGDVFVYHQGSVSFGDHRDGLQQQAMATLQRMHPGYEIAVQTHIVADPAKPLRQAVDAARLLDSNLPIVLFVNHNLGGGTLKHVRELAALLSTRMQTLLLCSAADNIHILCWLRDGESLELRFALPKDYRLLCDVLRALGVGRIHFHHLLEVDASIWRLPQDLSVPYDYTLHDYYPVCPRINLFNALSRYCGEPDEAGCNVCLQTTEPVIKDTTIQDWRTRHLQLLNAADRVLTPTRDVKQRMLRYAPTAHLVFAPHPEARLLDQQPSPAPLASNEPLRIVVLGALTQAKGMDVLEACALDAQQRRLPLAFHLSGYAARALVVEPNSRLQIHGSYADENLLERLAAINPHFAWFPAQWPETYCYALSACLQAGLPIVATDLGAFPERLAGRPWSWIWPWQTGPAAWNDFFMTLRKQHFAGGISPPAPSGPTPVAEFDYLCDYLRPLAGAPEEPACIPDGLAALLGACVAVTPPTKFDYTVWLQRHRWDGLACRHLLELTQHWATLPLIHLFIVLPASQSALLGSTLISLAQQTLAVWRLTVIADFACPSPEFAEMDELDWIPISAWGELGEVVAERAWQSPAEWFWCGQAGIQLEPVFINLVVELISRHPEWRLVYTDEDVAGQRQDQEYWSRPLFKPDANLDLLRSSGYVGHAVLMHRELWESLPVAELRPGLLLNYAAALRCFEQFGEAAIGHIDEMVFHQPEAASVDWLTFARDALPLLSGHLQRQNIAATISAGPLPGTFQVNYRLTQTPLVSIIIPTRNRLGLIQACLDSLLAKTRYPHFEVLVVDNRSDEPAVLDYLQQQSQRDSRIRIIPYPDEYNYSAINNYAARLAQGEFLLLLNNDTVILHDDWLETLVAIGLRPDVGAVGCRLIYPNHSVQHAGVIVGLGGVADHISAGLALGKSGYMGRAQLSQNFSAVTAACLLVRRQAFFEVGGLDEHDFAVLFNDVDFCLKLGARGYRIVWSPMVTLIHHGSSTLRADVNTNRLTRHQREQFALIEKWRARLTHDPAYNRHLSLRYRHWRLDDAMDTPWHPEFDPLPRVVALPCDNAGVGHYRTGGPISELTRQGHIRSLLLPDEQNPRCFMPEPIELSRIKAQVLLLQNAFTKRHLSALEVYAKLSPDVFKIFGLDDLVFALPPQNPARQHLGKDIKTQLRRSLALCDRAVVTSEPIAEALRGMIADVRVMPNYLERSRWTNLTLPQREHRKPRVGWAGGIHHAGDLALLQPVIEATATAVDWVFMGLCLDAARPYVAEIHPGVPFDAYPTALAALDLDLAIAPLEHNRFNRAKSNLRLLEYGILGWPVVCTDILPYQSAPVTLTPNNPDAWIKAIREHINDAETSKAAGIELQHWVLNHWMLEQHLDEWLLALLPDETQALNQH